MDVPDRSYLASLARRHDHWAVAAALVAAERRRGVHDLDALRIDPVAEVTRAGEVQVAVEDLPQDDCPVAGYYDHTSRTIILHPSPTLARDRFTILHELGHHVQRLVPEWADVWCVLPAHEGRVANEAVADAFAAHILVPPDLVDLSGADVTARQLVAAHVKVSTASRSALAHQVLRGARPADDVAVVVCDLAGEVVFARAHGQLFAPARGLVQPGLAVLLKRARAGSATASGDLAPGLVATSGAVHEGLRADVAIDTSGRFAFAVIRTQRRLAPATWADRTVECASAACGETFTPEHRAAPCRTCGEHRCLACGSCACANDATATCPTCHLAYTAAERAQTDLHECW
ncbi:ImmA/IrrE family metallo-endopeptidase [Pseudactinotalea sp. HY158]|uniref:ImmA/IrrE family metallo-endopeptidase n=1 Tax=Pseudactinotalea sp. HY158 TaxID=2654547 RepID=UPI00129C8133|nr:ImmA/IrrE family metallo-endopeptidase [Pseudactinotalea sp. HY158]QGH69778.1 ImmA/IrrE family metallo-endopeptidase [Pseudactinotalea sp. HY158]